MKEIFDKNGAFERIHQQGEVCLELGCGSRKRVDNSIGIDAIDYPAVDIVGDVFAILQRLNARTVDKIYAHHFIEHIDDLEPLLAELSRVVKNNGTLEIVVPHFSNPYFYSDPTHKRFFGLYTFCYFSNSDIFSRKVPNYSGHNYFLITKVDLGFKAARPFIFRYLFNRIIGFIFNSSTYLKELYESSFCWLFPCYEVTYRLIKINGNDVNP
jgi:ubiquinone/menaquinone biosynthesis C-methylase UbiE